MINLHVNLQYEIGLIIMTHLCRGTVVEGGSWRYRHQVKTGEVEGQAGKWFEPH